MRKTVEVENLQFCVTAADEFLLEIHVKHLIKDGSAEAHEESQCKGMMELLGAQLPLEQCKKFAKSVAEAAKKSKAANDEECKSSPTSEQSLECKRSPMSEQSLECKRSPMSEQS